jgi:hypothetical protein
VKFESGLLPLLVKVVEQLDEACVVMWAVAIGVES